MHVTYLENKIYILPRLTPSLLKKKIKGKEWTRNSYLLFHQSKINQICKALNRSNKTLYHYWQYSFLSVWMVRMQNSNTSFFICFHFCDNWLKSILPFFFYLFSQQSQTDRLLQVFLTFFSLKNLYIAFDLKSMKLTWINECTEISADLPGNHLPKTTGR